MISSLIQSSKDFLRKILRKLGIIVFRCGTLPYGYDHKWDIYRHIKNQENIKVIFDIGSNVGYTVIDYYKFFDDATIYAFEPITETFSTLMEKVSGIRNVSVHQLAFGAIEGEIEVWLRHNSQLNSLNPQINLSDNSPNLVKEIVKISTLDSFAILNKVEKIDLLKIDVEGFEIEVLQGATKLFEENKIHFIYIETSFNQFDKVHTYFGKIENFLSNYNFLFTGLYEQMPGDKELAYCNALFKNSNF